MLTRIISGAVGVIILAAVLFVHDTVVLPIAVAVIIAIMLFELIRAVKLEKCFPILIAAELCGIAVPLLYNSYYYTEKVMDGKTGDLKNVLKTDGLVPLLAFAVTLFCAFVIFVTWLRNHEKIRYEQVFFVLAAMILVPNGMSTLIRIDRAFQEDGLFLLVLALCGAWIADTGAYFTGVTLGKHKLCPVISPKKTIEGFIGGILTTGIAYAVATSVYSGEFRLSSAVMTFVLGIACAVIGTVGDLSASMVKRQIGFKDYGKIMPGHGGLMDRFDSVLFVVPTFYAFIMLCNELLKIEIV